MNTRERMADWERRRQRLTERLGEIADRDPDLYCHLESSIQRLDAAMDDSVKRNGWMRALEIQMDGCEQLLEQPASDLCGRPCEGCGSTALRLSPRCAGCGIALAN